MGPSGGGGYDQSPLPPPSSPLPPAAATSASSVTASLATAAALRDFYLEAQITASFDHENILSCLGVSKGIEIKHYSVSA